MRRPLFWILTALLAMIVVVGIIVAMTVNPSTPGAGAAASDSPVTNALPPTADVTTPTASATPPTAARPVALPTACEEIYTRDLTPEFGGLVLNPEWASSPDAGVQYGSRDERALKILPSSAELTCKWGAAGGGSDRGVTTNVGRLGASQAADIQAHFVEVGYSCFVEMGGVRCLTETSPSPDGQSGESHFFREDVWIATLWINAGPDGYTHDIVTAIFG